MTRGEIAVLWTAAYFGALVAFCSRLGYLLFAVAELPPEDMAQLAAWRRKRWWLIASEFSALPTFATTWTLIALQWDCPAPIVVLGSMASGALGFGFLLNALQALVMRKARDG
jgi:hypothetical protein